MNTDNRKQRASHLRWVKISEMVPSPYAQRTFQPSWADKLAANFNLEGMGFPVVNLRGGYYYVIDGQHRVAALKKLGFEDDTVQCETYENLGPAEEAELFLERNNNKTVLATDKFNKAVTAGRKDETTIDRVVRSNGLSIGRSSKGISAVGTLRKVYDRQGDIGLGRVIRIIRDAYGVAGFDAPVMDGISLCIHRYDGQMEDAMLIERLAAAPGGLNGLVNTSEKTRAAMGQPKAQCVAATVASFYNQGRGGKKLSPWWKE